MTSSTRQVVFFAIGIVLYIWIGVYFFNHSPDDTYITLRYAKNIAAGHGVVYNAGERVEGYSNPVFLALLTALQPMLETPRRMVLAAKWIGLIAGLLSLLLIAALARRDPEAAEHWGLAPLLVGLSGYPAYWAASGMETGLHLLLVVGALGAYIRSLETGVRWHRVLSGLLFALLALSRPEGILFLAAALTGRGVWLWAQGKKPDRADAALIVVAVLPVVVYVFWRHAYFGAWLPNTYYAKAAAGAATWADGVRYLIKAFRPAFWGCELLALLPLLLLWRWRQNQVRTMILLAAVGAQGAFIVLGGGDWMPGWRFALPAVVLLALLAPAAIARLPQVVQRPALASWLTGRRKWLPIGILLIFVIFHLVGLRQLVYAPSGWQGSADERLFNPQYRRVADWLRERARPGDWIATGEAGYIPYVTDLPTIDCFGLTDAHLARVPGKRHEKVDPEYILGRRPRFLVIGGARRSAAGFGSDFAYGRSLLNHPDTEAYYELAYAEGSFLVLVRREAAEL